MSYEKYMQSKKWRRRRLAYYRVHGRFCAVCGTAEEVTTHHISYDNFGNETNDDLIGLCQKHHTLYHQLYRTSCLENLVLFLADYQRPLLVPSNRDHHRLVTHTKDVFELPDGEPVLLP